MHRFNRTSLLGAAALLFLTLQIHCNSRRTPRVLLFTKSEFFIHENTPVAVQALQKICKDWDIQVDVEDDSEGIFTEENLRRYAAVIFLNTAGDVLDFNDETVFERYIQCGGGFVGIHSAVNTEHTWKWYGGLIGARYDSQSEEQEALLRVRDHNAFPTRHLDSVWTRRDVWFNLNDFDYNAQVLLLVDEASYEGGNMGAFHPVSWQHEYEGGRAFITTMGFTEAAYSDPAFVQHLYAGIIYAIGKNLPIRFQEQQKSQPAQTAGFVKTQLLCDLSEPMEFDMLPNGQLLFIERHGTIKLFDPESGHVGIVAEIPVFTDNEEGLTGMALDPDWQKNHWVYLYYSPEGDEPVTNLSRFTFDGEKLDLTSEKILFQLHTERAQLCHHGGGSLEFDEQGYLYISSGDNSSPYDVDGFAPIDERPGRSAWDAQKSSANTRDLRGKILRIRPLPDGSYICPAGNLFVERDIKISADFRVLLEDPLLGELIEPIRATPKGRIGLTPLSQLQQTAPGNTVTGGMQGAPEIYVMGCRNPYRYAIDSRRNLLIWGDIGPDAGLPDSTRGPEGYDEINWTRTAGFFGWPYFIGNNEPYREFDFETQVSGPAYNPERPVNNSPNNTGAHQLPPAKPAGIWYPFRSTIQFPLVANGTRCCMAGPAYYCDRYPAETRFPDRFDGTLIIYEWMRNWIMAVTLDSLDQYVSMEPLADGIRVARPIDMLIDKNGSLWLLEYGTEWYAANPDACISRIDYVRAAPGQNLAKQQDNVRRVHWDFSGKNRSFYQPGEVMNYQVLVSDPNNPNVPDKHVLSGLDITVDYVAAGINPFHRTNSTATTAGIADWGGSLIEHSDCKSCHDLERHVNGPPFAAIAKRYEKDPAAPGKLARKILEGGTGNWGSQMMAAHPQLDKPDVQEMVRWILAQVQTPESLPLRGTYAFSVPERQADGTFIFQARSNDDTETQLLDATIFLRPTLQQVEQADTISRGVRQFKPFQHQKTVLNELRDRSFFAFRSIDLYGIQSVRIRLGTGFMNYHTNGGRIELRLDGPEGTAVGSVEIPPAEKGIPSEVSIKLDQKNIPENVRVHDLYFVARSSGATSGLVAAVDWVKFVL
ncbi:MAG: carbohydrate-binding protein [Bacteroidetes bacterium]|nr:MAG: carbohydrate-binding protein [Bacteroidota bacterium]